MNGLLNILPGWVDLLGWTLVHSLWQFALLGLTHAVLMRAMRNTGAGARYAVSLAALAALVVLPVATFLWLAHGEAAPLIETATATTGISVDGGIAAADANGVAGLLQPAMPWIVAAWLAGVCVLSLRLTSLWNRHVDLRRHGLESLSDDWARRIGALAARLGIARPVRIMLSRTIDGPAVLGWLRPLVLLPPAALAGLSVAQLELILLHELAHVRRHDYLVNLMQVVLETVLFYHPAVHWISRSARVQREQCCDDMAVRACGNPMAYARALTELEALRLQPITHLALGAAGGNLFDRIQRLFSPAPRQRGVVWHLGMLAAAAAMGAAMTAQWVQAPSDSVPAASGDPDALYASLTVEPAAPAWAVPGESLQTAQAARAIPQAPAAESVPAMAVAHATGKPQAGSSGSVAKTSVSDHEPTPRAGDTSPEHTAPTRKAHPALLRVARVAAPPAPRRLVRKSPDTTTETTPAPAQPQVTPGVALDTPMPRYPHSALVLGREGSVTLKIHVGPDGRVHGATVAKTSGEQTLDEAALASVQSWEYQPWRLNGKPVAATVRHTFVFRLKSSLNRSGADCLPTVGTRICNPQRNRDMLRSGYVSVYYPNGSEG
ncbi:MAG: M56 family metallopeptidase [Gammaproteobacteria bacterium]|jgi:TonB family protein